METQMNADVAQMNVLHDRDHIPDIIVEDSLIVEVKAVSRIDLPHRQQCLNYLRAADLRLGLLLDFGRAHLEVGRVVYRF
jgi:GxxExxY protein